MKAEEIILEKYIEIRGKKDKIENITFDFKDLELRVLPYKEAKDYITENHYSHTIASSVIAPLGFFFEDKLVTAVIYGVPIGRMITKWLQVDHGSCSELTRLFSKDGLPKNTESYCIAQSFKYLKENHPDIKYLVSYSDPNHGHLGYIYQATNWKYVGLQKTNNNQQEEFTTDKRIFIDGKEVHRRTMNAKHGTSSIPKLREIYGDRLQRIPTLKKHVYIMCLGNKKERREWYSKFMELPYPKIENFIKR